ncbi:hypothetical protein [Frankia sp. Cas4]|uniref:hypothetical protein n=1 Tax=Frankia sp. Cas4 TaxID=3073927 RepID=UPI002AD2EB70|nr:hypothetical protein [Frankia sp. Cas4]
MIDRPAGPARIQPARIQSARTDRDAGSAARRAEVRRFIRENHPDRGGDPDVFMAGLGLRRPELSPRTAGGGVTAYHRRAGLAIVAHWVRQQWVHRVHRVHRCWRTSRRPPRVR